MGSAIHGAMHYKLLLLARPTCTVTADTYLLLTQFEYGWTFDMTDPF